MASFLGSGRSAFGHLFLFVLSFGLFGLYLVSQIPLATAWHRLILREQDSASHDYLIQGREGRYCLKAILIAAIYAGIFFAAWYVIAKVLFAPMMQGVVAEIVAGRSNEESFRNAIIIQSVVVYCLYGATAFFLAGLLLVLPAAAIGDTLGLGEGIRKLENNSGRFVAIFILAYLPVWLLQRLLRWAFEEPSFVIYLPALLFGPVLIGVLSIAYRELVQKLEAASGTAAQT